MHSALIMSHSLDAYFNSCDKNPPSLEFAIMLILRRFMIAQKTSCQASRFISKTQTSEMLKCAKTSLGDAFHASVAVWLWACLCSGGAGVLESTGRGILLEGGTVLHPPQLSATSAVGTRRGHYVTRRVWHLDDLLMGRITSSGVWQVPALLCYLSLML